MKIARNREVNFDFYEGSCPDVPRIICIEPLGRQRFCGKGETCFSEDWAGTAGVLTVTGESGRISQGQGATAGGLAPYAVLQPMSRSWYSGTAPLELELGPGDVHPC
jgi:hypothetical protein